MQAVFKCEAPKTAVQPKYHFHYHPSAYGSLLQWLKNEASVSKAGKVKKASLSQELQWLWAYNIPFSSSF